MSCASLNPYCSGQWSRTINVTRILSQACVLILIVVDNGLVLSLEEMKSACNGAS